MLALEVGVDIDDVRGWSYRKINGWLAYLTVTQNERDRAEQERR